MKYFKKSQVKKHILVRILGGVRCLEGCSTLFLLRKKKSLKDKSLMKSGV